MKSWLSWMAIASIAVSVNLSSIFAQDQQTDDKNSPKVEVNVSVDADVQVSKALEAIAQRNVLAEVTRSENASGRYWIGLVCEDAGEALRGQLNLPADVGLIVQDVMNDGPAMKAGILKNDILLALTVADKPSNPAKPIKTIADLIDEVQSAAQNPVRIELLRRGRKQTLEVVPELKANEAHMTAVFTDSVITSAAAGAIPYAFVFAGPVIVDTTALPEGVTVTPKNGSDGKVEALVVKKGDQTWETKGMDFSPLPDEIRNSVEQYWKSVASKNDSVRETIVRKVPGGLPDDVTVTIERRGSAPATIRIQKGEKTWEAKANQLQDLPAEVRSFVELGLQPPGVPYPLINLRGRLTTGSTATIEQIPATDGSVFNHIRVLQTVPNYVRSEAQGHVVVAPNPQPNGTTQLIREQDGTAKVSTRPVPPKPETATQNWKAELREENRITVAPAGPTQLRYRAIFSKMDVEHQRQAIEARLHSLMEQQNRLLEEQKQLLESYKKLVQDAKPQKPAKSEAPNKDANPTEQK